MAALTPVTMNTLQAVSGPTGKPDTLSHSFRNALTNIDKNYSSIEQQVNLAARNDKLSPSQLLAIQSGVLRSSLELDITSKVIEKISSGIRQTMNNQV
ncbi:MAG: hypothetical protein N3B13_06280 [Deltaproteobacteria bacterium]|nr:hypothetical protein [Deltaproteobacteria bacterium]